MGRRDQGPRVFDSARSDTTIFFGINFWDKFGLTFLGKGGREVAAVETTPDFDVMTGDLDMNNTLKPETAFTSHQLTPEQHFKLQQVIDTYPSCLEKVLGKTNLEQQKSPLPRCT